MEFDIGSFLIGILTLPAVAFLYIGIAKTVEGTSQWKENQQPFDELSQPDQRQTSSEEYWQKLAHPDQ